MNVTFVMKDAALQNKLPLMSEGARLTKKEFLVAKHSATKNSNGSVSAEN